MYKWTGLYIHNRKAKVQVKQHLSKKKTLMEGVPPDGVLFPTLYFAFILEILRQMPQTYEKPSTQTTLRYGAVKSTSLLQSVKGMDQVMVSESQ